MEKNAWMAMADVADAFMNCGLKPHNWKNIVVNVDINNLNHNLAYVRLGFGIRSAVRMFQALAQLMLLIIRQECTKRGFAHLIYHDMSYVDDSSCLAKTKSAAKNWLQVWKDIMQELGMPWQQSKIIEPSQIITNLGIICNTITMTLSISQERVTKALDLLQSFKDQKIVNLKDLQKIQGYLNFICTVVRFGKLSLRGLALMIKKLNETSKENGWSAACHHRISITPRVVNDFALLECLLTCFNGIEVTAPAKYPHAGCSPAQSDASFYGCGWWVQGIHGAISWKDQGLKIFDNNGDPLVSTAYVEALGLLELLKANAPFWAKKYVIIQLDNDSLVKMMIGEKTKSEQVLPIIAHCMGLIIAYAIKPKIMHIPAEKMIFADPLSRLSQPHHLYKKKQSQTHATLFHNTKKRWKMSHKTWIRPKASAPSLPQALELGKIWTTLQSKSLSKSHLKKLKISKKVITFQTHTLFLKEV